MPSFSSEIDKIAELSDEDRAKRLKAITMRMDMTAMQTLKNIMESESEPTKLKLEAAKEWIGSRAQIQIARERLEQKKDDDSRPQFNFNFGSIMENSDVDQMKKEALRDVSSKALDGGGEGTPK